ncbi:hypothetical protein [Romboutsia sp.]|uniref:hypothetical protein n=1 Tax=Romboutsia sp. TaxID=1965302 RepID=UPI003F3F01D2
MNIGKVLDVKYNFGGREITRRRYDYLKDINICEESCDFNIMPEDCKFNERAEIIWEIE